MPLLQWTDEYEIGIHSVDYEHFALIDVINLLGTRLDPKHGAAEIRKTLGQICKLVAAHFANEESIMRDLHYDRYAEHKADHDRLLEEIREISNGVADDPDADCRIQLGERVGCWFGRHFASFDARLNALVYRPGLNSRE